MHVSFAPEGASYRATNNGAVNERRYNNRGFSLIELLVAMAILALIASFVGPALFSKEEKAKVQAAKVQIQNLAAGVDLYRLEMGKFPPSLESLVRNDSGDDRWNGPYLRNKKSIPKDPWGNDFVYATPGEHGTYDLISLGADGSEGGEGDGADIGNWD